MSMMCEAAGVKPPAIPLDGASILPPLMEKMAKLKRNMIMWHFSYYHKVWRNTKPCSALRKSDMKLIYYYEDERAELYKLIADPQKSNNLANTQSRFAAKLKNERLTQLVREGVYFPQKR